MASWLTANLIKEGHQVSLLSGEMTVEQRAAVIERYRNGKEKVLVTTNVCSRGGTDTEHHGRGQHVRWMFEANHKQLCTSGHFKESTWNKWHWWSTLTSQWIWKEMPTTRRTFIGLAAQDASARGDLLSIWWTASKAWILSNKLRCISVCLLSSCIFQNAKVWPWRPKIKCIFFFLPQTGKSRNLTAAIWRKWKTCWAEWVAMHSNGKQLPQMLLEFFWEFMFTDQTKSTLWISLIISQQVVPKYYVNYHLRFPDVITKVTFSLSKRPTTGCKKHCVFITLIYRLQCCVLIFWFELFALDWSPDVSMGWHGDLKHLK